MPRFPMVSRDAVPQDQVDAFDALVSARGGVVGWSGLAGAVGIHQIYFPVAAPVGTKRGLSAIE